MYLLLCEVALGNMHECKSEILKELPTGKDSIKGTCNMSSSIRCLYERWVNQTKFPKSDFRQGCPACINSNNSFICEGVGKNRLTQREELDGCPLAMGPMQPYSDTTINLNYDEYVIYDAARVRIKYLVEIRRVR